MIEIINGIFSNRMLFIVGVTYGVPITIALIILFFVKSSRDERGRAIIGKASIIAIIHKESIRFRATKKEQLYKR